MYNKEPKIKISNEEKICTNKVQIMDILKAYNKIAFECYPGTNIKYLEKQLLNKFTDYQLVFVDKYANKEIEAKLSEELTDDRVFGVMTRYTIDQFYDTKDIEVSSKVLYYGFGASLLNNDCIVYLDLARWEIQKRFRNGMSNWNIHNPSEDNLKKFKRGYFFEWRIADRLKAEIFQQVDYFLDITKEDQVLKFIDGNSIRSGLTKACNTPIRLVPFFDPAVWGGTWMEENCGLEHLEKNYGWSFDGVPEENSIMLEYGSNYIELPAMTLVKYKPQELLGACTYHRFGDEFPIRFDFLDTINGGNLSLQVHPIVEYIQECFNMNYTQDESYYVLDADEEKNPSVYLGFKEGVDKNKFLDELEEASKGTKLFDVEKYINKFPVKKGDHVLIPAGTIHCSGEGTMILEISATPYIFTFKLWDWGRLGLDGLPRPTHIEHGKKVLNFDCTTSYAQKELVNNITKISDNEVKTGLHKTQFIETRRFETNNNIVHETNNEFHMLNLVDGESIIISSPTGQFEDYKVSFAETFIIPANVDSYEIKPVSGKVTYIKAYVRF